jgi:hypothetical protein
MNHHQMIMFRKRTDFLLKQLFDRSWRTVLPLQISATPLSILAVIAEFNEITSD